MTSLLSPVIGRGALLALAGLLGGCGGHTGNGGAAAGSADGEQSATLRVIDGRVRGVKVCLDLNRNDVCDSEEPFGITDANGKVTIIYPVAQFAGCPPWLAEVGTDAVDLETGPVLVPYKVSAPCTSAVVSPQTSLVSANKDMSGSDTEKARAEVRALLKMHGLDFDPFADYTLDQGVSSRIAADFASLLVLVKQELIVKTGFAPGAADVLDKVLLALTGKALGVVNSAEITALTDPVARREALRLAAKRIAEESGLDAQNIGQSIVAVAARREVVAPDQPTLALFSLFFDQDGNYDYGQYLQSAGQNIPDNDGLVHFTEYRQRGQLTRLDQGSRELIRNFYQYAGASYARNEVLWTGSEWFDCPPDQLQDRGARDANGVYRTTLCKAHRYDTLSSFTSDLGGLPYKMIRDAIVTATPEELTASDLPFEPPSWAEQKIAAGALWPGGAAVTIERRIEAQPPDTYSKVDQPTLAIPATRCGAERATRTAASLDELLQVGANRCASGPFNGSWDYALLRLSPGSDGKVFFSIGASFVPERQQVTYWSCDLASQCLAMGRGIYTIDQVGDARVLRLRDLPGEVRGRSFVERGGQVYYGTRLEPGTTSVQIMLNQTANNALFGQLGLDCLTVPFCERFK